jgi:hypothetical protein
VRTGNRIGADGARAIADALQVNETLFDVGLSSLPETGAERLRANRARHVPDASIVAQRVRALVDDAGAAAADATSVAVARAVAQLERYGVGPVPAPRVFAVVADLVLAAPLLWERAAALLRDAALLPLDRLTERGRTALRRALCACARSCVNEAASDTLECANATTRELRAALGADWLELHEHELCEVLECVVQTQDGRSGDGEDDGEHDDGKDATCGELVLACEDGAEVRVAVPLARRMSATLRHMVACAAGVTGTAVVELPHWADSVRLALGLERVEPCGIGGGEHGHGGAGVLARVARAVVAANFLDAAVRLRELGHVFVESVAQQCVFSCSQTAAVAEHPSKRVAVARQPASR